MAAPGANGTNVRKLLPVLCLIALGLPAAARADGILSDVPRSQFGDNVPLGSVRRIPAGTVAPTLKTIDGDAADWDVGTTPTALGGTTTVQAGQLVYEDWPMDDSGAAAAYVVARRDRNQPLEDALGWSRYQQLDSAAGEELIGDVDEAGAFDNPPLYYEKGLERYGEARYATGTSGSADLTELRLAADATTLSVLVRFYAMLPTDTPVVAVAIDTDRDPSTGDGAWGFGSGVATPGADHVLTITRDAVLLDGVPASGAQVASDDLGAGSASNPGGFGGIIEASVPRDGLGGSRWRVAAGTGVWDGSAWAAPRTDPKAQPEDAPPRVMNLAFRGGAEPLRPWMEEHQAFALRRGPMHLDAFWADADLDALAAGTHETWRLAPGFYVRTMTTRVTDGGRRNSQPAVPEASPNGARQPYGMYVPTTYDPARLNPVTVWLHWRGPGDHVGAYYVPTMVWQLGEERGNVIVSPRGRGSSGWYVGDSQIDVLDAIDDASVLARTDPDRTYVAGYSMGGWGAYLFSTQYPDRFAGALSVVGPPAIGAWFYPASPSAVAGQNGRPGYFTNPMVGNARYVPTAIYHGTDDELVPVSGTTAQAKTYQDNKQPYRYYLFPGYEHFSFAVADEWATARDYLGNRARVRNPSYVHYARLPCLDPVHWGPAYDVRAQSAYWVSGIEVRRGPTGAACTSTSTPWGEVNTTGTVDVASFALPRTTDAGGPVASAGGPPDHSTPWIMSGYEPRPQAGGGPRNEFLAATQNVSEFRIDLERAALRVDRGIKGTVFVSDGNLTLHVGVCAQLTVDGVPRGPFCDAIDLSPGIHTLVIS